MNDHIHKQQEIKNNNEAEKVYLNSDQSNLQRQGLASNKLINPQQHSQNLRCEEIDKMNGVLTASLAQLRQDNQKSSNNQESKKNEGPLDELISVTLNEQQIQMRISEIKQQIENLQYERHLLMNPLQESNMSTGSQQLCRANPVIVNQFQPNNLTYLENEIGGLTQSYDISAESSIHINHPQSNSKISELPSFKMQQRVTNNQIQYVKQDKNAFLNEISSERTNLKLKTEDNRFYSHQQLLDQYKQRKSEVLNIVPPNFLHESSSSLPEKDLASNSRKPFQSNLTYISNTNQIRLPLVELNQLPKDHEIHSINNENLNHKSQEIIDKDYHPNVRLQQDTYELDRNQAYTNDIDYLRSLRDDTIANQKVDSQKVEDADVIERRVREMYEQKLEEANRKMQMHQDMQEKQAELLNKERQIRIQMQLRLEEFEAERRSMFNSIGHSPNTTDKIDSSFARDTACGTTPSKKIEIGSYSKPEQLSIQSMHQGTIMEDQFEDEPINHNYNVTPNKQNTQSFDKTDMIQHQVRTIESESSKDVQMRQQLISIISRLQTVMSEKQKNISPQIRNQIQIETANKLDSVMDIKLDQLKLALTKETKNVSQDIPSSSVSHNIIFTSEFTQ